MSRVEQPDRPALFFLGYTRETAEIRGSIEGVGASIDIYVHEKAIPKPTDFEEQTVKRYMVLNGIEDPFFYPSADREWGFGGALRQSDTAIPAWKKFSCTLPILAQENGEFEQGGQWYGHSCTIGTLRLLFDHFTHANVTTDATIPQMMYVGLRRGIEAYIQPSFRRWAMNTLLDIPFETTQVMVDAYTAMVGQIPIDLKEFHADFGENGLLFMYCPYRSGLYPDAHSTKNPREEYRLMPHVVNPLQQLTLLAGLSSLCNLAVQESQLRHG